VLFPMNRVHAITLSRVSRVIAVSEAVARSLKAQRVFPTDKITVVRNGIDVEHFAAARNRTDPDGYRQSLRIAPDRLIVGTVGEIKPLKGYEEFLLACSVVARRFPNVEFVIAGQDTSGSKENLEALKRRIGELELGDRVHLLGWVDDVAPLLCSMDLFVSASHTESFGLALAEAMASGTPVIATPTDGALEIIDDGQTGIIVPHRDIDKLANAIIDLLENKEERTRMGLRGLEVARERFTLDRMVEATEAVYSAALAR